VRLTRRLVLHAAAVAAAAVLFASAGLGARADAHARAGTLARLRAEAALAARAWPAPTAADPALADSLGTLLGRHVTLVDARGQVRGDSEARDLAAGWLARYAALAEVRAAAAAPPGAPAPAAAASPASSAAGAPELAAAARAGGGVVRVAAPAAGAGAELAGALRRGLALAGLGALGVGALGALLFARAVVRPLAELRDVARALAAGDLARRPALSAPGEVGEVADAVHRLAEQLTARFDALAAEEALLEALTESLAEGVVAVDARGRVVRANATARRLLRLRDPVPFPADYLPRERVLGEALAAALAGRVLADDDDPGDGVPTGPPAAPPGGGALELRMHGRTLALTARPLPAGGAVLAFYDLTPVRRLEAVRRDFVANVSHELKTPLTAVAGYAETLADDPSLADAPRRFAGTIAANAGRMQRIVDDLLDLSRIESGGWRPTPAAVDVAAAADDALGPAREAAAAKGVALDVAPDPAAPVLWADPTAARQVLSNLVENAVRHTAAGAVTVTTEPGEQGVWLVVRDTGAGIAPEHLPRVFERFYRADPGRARTQGGTGLGLAIVKHLAEAHGGAVRADSRLGGGTAIAVLFPAAGAPAAAAVAQAVTATARPS
jgi:signal transduction histidine kinase